MKHFASLVILIACAFLLAPTIQAQDCSNWTLWDTRGTYAMSGSGWVDLSTLNPALPKGYVPLTFIGAFTNNGQGGGTGWGILNAGGMQMTGEFVNVKYGAPAADCSQSFTYSMKIKELGVTVGPFSHPGVIAGDMSNLEILSMLAGTGPGGQVDSGHAKRISMKFN